MNNIKQLDAKGNGEYRYDYKHDILFFKIKDRDYQSSLELGDVILDMDKEGYPTGVQIFNASDIFKIDKPTLRSIQKWKFHIKLEKNIVTLQLMFIMVKENKQIVERGENLVREASSELQDREVLCAIPN